MSQDLLTEQIKDAIQGAYRTWLSAQISNRVVVSGK